MAKAELLAKSKPKREDEDVQAVQSTARDKRILSIIEKIKGKGAPSMDELEEWAASEPPPPTFPYRLP